MMYTLYTSVTCPRGVRARQFLQHRAIPFAEINLDRPAGQAKLDQVWQLLRTWKDDVETPLFLPVLTQTQATPGNQTSPERVVMVGFEDRDWEALFSPLKQSIKAETSQGAV